MVKYGFEWHVHVRKTLVHMYGMVKEVRVARKLFDEMLEPDLVAWNTVIDCCGEYREGLELFSCMHDVGVRPRRITRSCFHVCMFVVWSINMKESQVVTMKMHATMHGNKLTMPFSGRPFFRLSGV